MLFTPVGRCLPKSLHRSFLMLLLPALVLPAAGGLAEGASSGGEWPMSRHDSQRTAWTPHALPLVLSLHWLRELPEPKRAWPWQMDDFEKLAFDASYEPVVARGLVFIASMTSDTITAYDAETGEEKWRHVADGPVRLAPTVADDRLYAVSDDGHLYCLNADTGEKHWKFRAGPSGRKVLGNERLISIWAARGGPVLADGLVYFAAGLWPNEGVFIYALDAKSGKLVWRNSGSQSDMIIDSKRYYSFGGVVPQGQMIVQGDRLLVAGGRTAPAAFDRHTGELLYFNIASSTTTKAGGGHRVFAHGDWYFNMRDKEVTHMYAIADGAQLGHVTIDLVSDAGFIGVSTGTQRITAFDTELEETSEPEPPAPVYDRRGRPIADSRMDAIGRDGSISDRLRSGALSEHYRLQRAWVSGRIDGLERLHAMAGNTMYGSGEGGRLFAIAAPEDEDGRPEVVWTATVEGEVFAMVPALDRLYVTTENGRLYAFGAGEQDAETHPFAKEPLSAGTGSWESLAQKAIESTDLRGGYALFFGLGSGEFLEALLAQSEDLHVTAYDPDPAKVAAFRERFLETGHYGSRVAIHTGTPATVMLPPYVASLVASEDPAAIGDIADPALARALFHPLRPYGGKLFMPLQDADRASFEKAVEDAALEKFALHREMEALVLERPGALPDAGTWTHQYADAGNSAFSADKRVKAPLGLAWFGGEPNHKTLPRHMHGPIPQVVDGRLLILGPHHISARCVYTGIELWNQELPEVGQYYTDWDYEAREAPVYFPNNPGANFIGSPYATASDNIYLIHEDACLRIDTVTGEILDTFEMPDIEDLRQYDPDPIAEEYRASYGARLQEGQQLKWGNIRYAENVLVAAAYPHMFDDRTPGREDNWNMTSSEFLVGMDRHSGEILWIHQARYGFRHNAIAASGDKVFLIDNLSEEIREILNRRGIEPDIAPEVRALDLATGTVLWTHDEDVFGTSLSYSAPQDVLVQSGHPGRRRALPDEPQDRLHALRGADGETLWAGFFPHRRSPLGMHTSWGRVVGSTGELALDMLTGEAKTRKHPLTGEVEDWSWVGALRCGTQNFSEHLIFFRSGVAGFADLAGGGPTGNITGYRPGCTNNMVVADGMLNSPEYSRSCSCSYQMQTSLGLVHMPENEMWTYNAFPDPAPGTVRRAGINFGAPASRLDSQSDVLWLEYPPLVGPAPELEADLQIDGDELWFRHHATFIEEENGGLRWVAASGVEGESRFRLAGLYAEENPGSLPKYTVRLHFAEPDADVAAGERRFDVRIQDETVLEGFDILAEAGGPMRGAVAEFKGIQPTDEGVVQVALSRANGTAYAPVISGVEVLIEE